MATRSSSARRPAATSATRCGCRSTARPRPGRWSAWSTRCRRAAATSPTPRSRAAHTEGKARLIRLAVAAGSAEDRAAALRRVEAAIDGELARQGAAVEGTIEFATLRAAMDAHVLILVRAALLLSAIIALIGLVGLAATIGIGVAARTREIGMMKAVGATDRRILRLVLGEAVLVGAASWLASAILAVPVTAAIDRFLSGLGFLSASLVISPGAIAGWLAVVVLGSALAALAPARRAARITVRDALAES